jgi:hypothetical protein
MTYNQRKLRKKYTRVVKDGPFWKTYLGVPGDGFYQEFCVSGDQGNKREADYFARMLAKALKRLLKMETKPPTDAHLACQSPPAGGSEDTP